MATAAAARLPRRDYSRLEGTPFARERVGAVTALVVGAGALGNEVIKNLALIGIGKIWVVDPDRLEASNLTRSILFCIGDIEGDLAAAPPKALLAAQRARQINPDVETHGWVSAIADFGLGWLRRADVVFSCVDNEMARLELAWACSRVDVLLVDGGLGLRNHSSGQVTVYPGSQGPCYGCRLGSHQRTLLLQHLQGREDPCWVKDRAARERGDVSTTPILASAVAAMQVEIGLRFERAATRAALGFAHRLTLHPGPTLEMSTIERSPSCPLHQAESIISSVEERGGQASRVCTPADLLDNGSSVLTLDWPVTALAECEACGHSWEPMVRRARFRSMQCPACSSSTLIERQVLTAIPATGAWSGRSLLNLGLPVGHIHEVATEAAGILSRRHVELTGDFAADGAL